MTTRSSKGVGAACNKHCQWYEICTERETGYTGGKAKFCEDFVDYRYDVPLDNKLLRGDKREYLEDWWEYIKTNEVR